jgi:hypothetical protein
VRIVGEGRPFRLGSTDSRRSGFHQVSLERRSSSCPNSVQATEFTGHMRAATVTIARLGSASRASYLNPDVIHPLLVGLCMFLRLNVVSGKSLCCGKDYRLSKQMRRQANAATGYLLQRMNAPDGEWVSCSRISSHLLENKTLAARDKSTSKCIFN